jgi:HEAT repeat protein
MRLRTCASRLLVICFLVGGAGVFRSAADAADVKQLAAALSAGSATDRLAAADALADQGFAAQEAVPQLVAALGGSDAELQWRAARALGVIGSPQAIPALRKTTDDADAMVRAQAIFALGRLKAADEDSLKAIIAKLTDKEVQVRRAAVRALALIKADRNVTLPLVVKLLEDSDPQVAMRALGAIAEGGAESIPALNAALAHPEARYWACLALSEMGPEAKDAVPGLRNVLADERPQVRLQATIALAEIGPAARPALLELTKLLADKFESVRNSAVFAIGRIGDKSAAEAVSKVDNPNDPALHMLCTWALARMNPEDKPRQKEAVERLAGKLGDKDRNAAHMAARAIAELEPAADVIRPAMEKVVAGADAETADRIFNALASLGAKVVPLAINALKDPTATRRERAMRVLSKVGPDAAPAVPELVSIIQGTVAKERIEALFVVGAIGPGASGAVKAVVAALADTDPQVQQYSSYALGKIGPPAREAVPALKQLTMSSDELVKMTAIWALLQIGPQSDELVKAALPVLTSGLGSSREMVRVEAAMSLGSLGKAASSALPALEKSLQDPNASVRNAANEAIGKIKG